MKNKLIVIMVLLTSGLVSAQSNFGVGLEHSLRTNKDKTTQTKLLARLSVGHALKLSESFTLESNAVVTSDSLRGNFNYVLSISDDIAAHAGLNVGNALRIGAQIGATLQDRYLIEYVRVNSDFEEKPEGKNDSLAIGLKFGF